jgi:hypothetical protein
LGRTRWAEKKIWEGEGGDGCGRRSENPAGWERVKERGLVYAVKRAWFENILGQLFKRWMGKNIRILGKD